MENLILILFYITGVCVNFTWLVSFDKLLKNEYDDEYIEGAAKISLFSWAFIIIAIITLYINRKDLYK